MKNGNVRALQRREARRAGVELRRKIAAGGNRSGSTLPSGRSTGRGLSRASADKYVTSLTGRVSRALPIITQAKVFAQIRSQRGRQGYGMDFIPDVGQTF